MFSRARHGLLHGLRALGIVRGDEILAPAYHHGSEVEALERAGARCVFYDCDEALAPDAAELERLVGPRTRALHLTHHLGFPQDAARWRRWCDERGLALIEDAAQAWLARTGDRPVGAFGDIAIFSLYKTFGLPDGGALLCRPRAQPPAGPQEAAVVRLGLEHGAWIAGRSPAAGGLVARLRPTRPYDATADRRMGAPRPPSHATMLALRRVVDPGAAEERRRHYELLAGRRRRPRAAAVPGAGPGRLPARRADRGGRQAGGAAPPARGRRPRARPLVGPAPVAAAARPPARRGAAPRADRAARPPGAATAGSRPDRDRRPERLRMRLRWIIAALALCAAALVGLAFDAQRGGPSGAGAMPSRIGAPLPVEPARPPARVAYTGPRRLDGTVTLRARVARAGAPVVAVTFLLGGRPLGTDTTAPYALDVDASLLPAGHHRLRVVAVDRLGSRTTGRAVPVQSAGVAAAAGLTATPATGLGPVLPALARGHVTVRLAPGRYSVPHLELGGGARLVGSGRRTVLEAAAGGWSLMTVRGRGVRVSDLTIDGAGRAERAIGVAGGSHDVRLQRLRIRGIRETGVEVWGAHSGVSVQDSTIAGGGADGAGVFALGSDESRDTSVIRTRISGFRSHGINFAQRAYDRPRAALHSLALDNQISDIDDPAAARGTHEGGIWSGGVAAVIVGNRIRDTGWDGIQTVGSSRGVTVVGNDIARTGVGIYLEHETGDSLFARNTIADVATGINVEWRYDDAGSSGNTFEANTILRPSDAGLFVDVEGDRNRIVDNVVVGGSGPAVVLQGASGNLVTGNRACGRPGDELVVQQSAHHDDGRAAHSLRNRIADNVSADSCPAR